MELEKSAPVSNDVSVEIDLIDLAHYLFRRIKYIIIAAIIGFILASVYIFIIATPMYESTAQLYVVNSRDSALNLSDLQIGTYLTSDYELVFKTWEVNQQVKNNLNLDYSIEELRNMVDVSNPNDTRALFVTVTSPSPAEAALLANEYAEVAKQYIYDTMLSEMPTTLSVALEPTSPVSPRRTMILFASILISVLICCFILSIFYLSDDKVKTPEDVFKYTGAMPLAIIPVAKTSIRRERSSSIR